MHASRVLWQGMDTTALSRPFGSARRPIVNGRAQRLVAGKRGCWAGARPVIRRSTHDRPSGESIPSQLRARLVEKAAGETNQFVRARAPNKSRRVPDSKSSGHFGLPPP